MTTDTIIIEAMKYLGPAGVGSAVTAYILTKYNNRKNGNPGKPNIFPCDLHKSLMDEIMWIKDKISDMPMTIIEIFQKIK